MARVLVIDDSAMTIICDIIGAWYGHWKPRMTDDNQPHRLGNAKEDLKLRIDAARQEGKFEDQHE